MEHMNLEAFTAERHHLVTNLHNVRESNLIEALRQPNPALFRRRHFSFLSFFNRGSFCFKHIRLRPGKRASDREQLGVDRHATTASAPSKSSASTSCWLRMPPATMSWRRVSLRRRALFRWEALQKALAIDMCVEKCGGMGFELRDGRVGREGDLGLPAFDGDTAVLGVDSGDDAVGANCGGEGGGEFCVDGSCSETTRSQ